MDPKLLAWMEFLIRYAENWDKTFRSKDPSHQLKYFTQEYWYLFTVVVTAEAKGHPITRAEAMAAMKVPYHQDTLIERIDDAIADKLLTEGRSPRDRRKVVLMPTDALRKAMTEHLATTFAEARELFRDAPP